MRHSFDNLIEAVELLKEEGYIIDLEQMDLSSIKDKCFKVVEKVFMEGGDSSAETSMMIYLLESVIGEKGYLISPHSIYKDEKIEHIESLLN